MTPTEDALSEQRTPPPARVRRFEPVERFAHWWVVVCFAMTLLSGLSLGEDGGGHLSGRLLWHIVSASALVGGVLLLPLLPGRRALWQTLRALLRLGPAARGAGGAPRASCATQRGGPVTQRGKFNLGQTLMAYAIVALMAGMYVTGIAAVSAGGGEGEGGPHGAFVAVTVVVLAGHVFLALVFPPTRPALRGMLTGWVDRTWAQRHHPEWVMEVEAE